MEKLTEHPILMSYEGLRSCYFKEVRTKQVWILMVRKGVDGRELIIWPLSGIDPASSGHQALAGLQDFLFPKLGGLSHPLSCTLWFIHSLAQRTTCRTHR